MTDLIHRIEQADEGMQRVASEMASLLAALPANKTIRFSIFDGAYQWQSVKTRDRAVSKLLLLMWNNRELILSALKAREASNG